MSTSKELHRYKNTQEMLRQPENSNSGSHYHQGSSSGKKGVFSFCQINPRFEGFLSSGKEEAVLPRIQWEVELGRSRGWKGQQPWKHTATVRSWVSEQEGSDGRHSHLWPSYPWLHWLNSPWSQPGREQFTGVSLPGHRAGKGNAENESVG